MRWVENAHCGPEVAAIASKRDVAILELPVSLVLELHKGGMPIVFVGVLARKLELEYFASQSGQEHLELVIIEWADALQQKAECVACGPVDQGLCEGLYFVTDALLRCNEHHRLCEVNRMEVSCVISEFAIHCANYVMGWLAPCFGQSRRQNNLTGVVCVFSWRVERHDIPRRSIMLGFQTHHWSPPQLTKRQQGGRI